MNDRAGWFDVGVPTVEPLVGGVISSTARWSWPDGSSVVVKRCADAGVGMYAAEAASLDTLARTGCVGVPLVLDVRADRLVLEDLGSHPMADADWAELGRDVARLHQVTAAKFGFESTNYLGLLPQHNTWRTDGHMFFAEHRILRYLDEPHALEALTTADRRRIEHLACRLPVLVPPQPASLLHGDLWWANVIGPSTPGGRPRLVDPACWYGWAEADLSMLWSCGHVTGAFWSAYQEIRPLDAGWQERMSLLNIRELLSVIAHFGNRHGSVDRLRDILTRWAD